MKAQVQVQLFEQDHHEAMMSTKALNSLSTVHVQILNPQHSHIQYTWIHVEKVLLQKSVPK